MCPCSALNKIDDHRVNLPALKRFSILILFKLEGEQELFTELLNSYLLMGQSKIVY